VPSVGWACLLHKGSSVKSTKRCPYRGTLPAELSIGVRGPIETTAKRAAALAEKFEAARTRG
jgi:hypothetical protein